MSHSYFVFPEGFTDFGHDDGNISADSSACKQLVISIKIKKPINLLQLACKTYVDCYEHAP